MTVNEAILRVEQLLEQANLEAQTRLHSVDPEAVQELHYKIESCLDLLEDIERDLE